MFLGVSKNVGGGFRIGVGTRIGSPGERKRDKDFHQFMEKVEAELEQVLASLLDINDIDVKKVRKDKADVNELLSSSTGYEPIRDAIQILLDTVEEVNFSGDTGVVGRRKITRVLFAVKEAFKNSYPDYDSARQSSSSKYTPLDLFVKAVIWAGILFFPLIFSWFTLSDKFGSRSRQIAFFWLFIFLYLIYLSSGNGGNTG